MTRLSLHEIFELMGYGEACKWLIGRTVFYYTDLWTCVDPHNKRVILITKVLRKTFPETLWVDGVRIDVSVKDMRFNEHVPLRSAEVELGLIDLLALMDE